MTRERWMSIFAIGAMIGAAMIFIGYLVPGKIGHSIQVLGSLPVGFYIGNYLSEPITFYRKRKIAADKPEKPADV